MIPSNIKEEDFIYNEADKEIVLDSYNKFVELLNDFLNTISNIKDEVEINQVIVCHIHRRVDQRKDYYMYFHSTKNKVMHLSHEKEIGLWSYWVSKYKPIRFKNIENEKLFYLENGCTLSDAFAVYMMISIICNKKKTMAKHFTPEKIMELYYDFSNRDFSKEAIIARIEDLVK